MTCRVGFKNIAHFLLNRSDGVAKYLLALSSAAEIHLADTYQLYSNDSGCSREPIKVILRSISIALLHCSLLSVSLLLRKNLSEKKAVLESSLRGVAYTELHFLRLSTELTRTALPLLRTALHNIYRR
jgi:hypothetical protein